MMRLRWRQVGCLLLTIGMSGYGHGPRGLWGSQWQIPDVGKGGVGGRLVPQRVLELVDRIVSAQALAGQGAGGVTGLSVVKEAVERGLLEAGVEGWHYCGRRIGIPKATEPSRGSTLEGLQLRLRTAKIW